MINFKLRIEINSPDNLKIKNICSIFENGENRVISVPDTFQYDTQKCTTNIELNASYFSEYILATIIIEYYIVFFENKRNYIEGFKNI